MRVCRLCVFASLLAALCGTGGASLTTANLTAGDSALVYDNTTGLEWMSLSLTRHLAAGDIFALFGPGQAYAGWRFATKAEVLTLWAHAGLTGLASGLFQPDVNGSAAALQAVLGVWPSGNGQFNVTSGFIEDTSTYAPPVGTPSSTSAYTLTGPPQRVVAELKVTLSLPTSVRTWFTAAPSSSRGLGSYLVRTSRQWFPSVFYSRINGESICGNQCTRDQCPV